MVFCEKSFFFNPEVLYFLRYPDSSHPDGILEGLKNLAVLPDIGVGMVDPPIKSLTYVVCV